MSLSRHARGPLAPLVAAITIWAVALAGLGTDGPRTDAVAADPRPTASPASGPSSTPAPLRLGDLDLHFAVKGQTSFFRGLTAPRHPRRIFAVRQDGSKLRETSAWPGVPFDQYSLDGGFIVYEKTISSAFRPYSGCGVAGCTSGYYSSRSAGIVVRRRGDARGTFLTEDGYDHDPKLSPDGRVIAFLSHIRENSASDGQADVTAFVTPTGGFVGALPRKPGTTDSSVAWAPDGRRVAIVRTRAGDRAGPSVEVWTADGRFVRRLARGDYRDLVWSHDGTRIAAIRQMTERDDRNDPGYQTGQDVFVLPATGGAPDRVTRIAPAIHPNISVSHCGHSKGVFLYARTPMWSPDDTKIAFITNHLHAPSGSDASDIAVTAADGSKLRILRSTPRTTCKGPRGGHYDHYTENVELLGWRYTKLPPPLDDTTSI